MIPSKYLKQDDVGDEEITVTVQSLKKVNVAQEDEIPEYKWTVKFAEFEKGMVLNSTNIKRMSKALGDDTNDWEGGHVILYVDHDVEFAGKTTGGLRVKAVPRKGTAGKPQSDDEANRRLREAAADVGDDIPF